MSAGDAGATDRADRVERAERVDVVVVGGGAAGAVVAARLGRDARRRVLLLEAGAAPRSAAEYPDELRGAASLHGADPAHPDTWAYPATLAEGRPHTVVRGRILGGSTAVNGAYFVRARRADFDRWAAAGLSGWGFEECLPTMRALESDADFADTVDADGAPLHGTSGPMPVRRPALDGAAPHPVSAAFAAAADALGVPREPDKNGEQPEGHGPLPVNVRPGIEGGYERWNTARAYLLGCGGPADADPGATDGAAAPAHAGPGGADASGSPEVRGAARVTRVLFDGTTAVGVEVEQDGMRTRVSAGLVVLAAGAIGTAELLLRSGVGPRAELQRHGIPVVVEAPGVGAAFSDHPQFALGWHPRPGALPPAGILFDWLLNTALPVEGEHAGAVAEVELLPMLRGLRAALGVGGDDPVLLVGLQNPEARGRVRLNAEDPEGPPDLEYRYLAAPTDRARARAAVRFALALLERPEFAAVSAGHDGPPAAVLGDDEALDAWLLDHLGTAQHLCGTAPMGAADDPCAVTDSRGAVRGTTALHVADLALLPSVPSRGPAATAVLIGERIAAALLTRT